MKFKGIRIISIVLVFILLIVSCSNGKKEPLEEIGETDISEANENDEEMTMPVIDEPEDTVVVKPTKNEIEFFNQLAGGFFYTEKSGDDYSKARIVAIDLLNDQVIEVLEECFELYESGIKSYEDQILFFIDDIDESRSQYNEDLQYIIDQMMAYKAAMNTLMYQGNDYFEKVEDYDFTDVNKAVLDGEIFAKTVALYETLDEYLLFLESTGEYLASGIIEDFDIDYAEVLRQDTREIFSQDILPELIAVVKAYDLMSMMYVSINSGDYFYTKSMATKIINHLSALEQTQQVKTIKEGFIEAMENPSDYLIIIETKGMKENTFKIPFIKTVYAGEVESNSYTTGLGLLYFIEEITMDSDLSEDEMDALMMNLILQKNNVKLEEIKNQIEKVKEETPELLIPETLLVLGGEKLMAMAGADPVYGFGSVENKIIPIKLNADQIEIKKEINVSKIQQAVKQEIISQNQREEMIEKIKKMQSSDEAIGGNFLMALSPDLGGDFVYDKVVKSLTNVLGENEGKMKGETFQSLNQLLQNDLEEILGSKKAEFANNILNASAEDMVNRFAEWANNSKNRKDLEINKNNLITFLDAMGFEHEGTLDEEENLEIVEENETAADVVSDNAYSENYDNEEILLDYLS